MTRTSLLPSLRKLIPPTGLLRKDLASWYLYDWGASAFTTSVITVFFGPFVTSLASAAADHSGQVHPFGIAVHAGAFYPYIISLSVLLQICLLPILGAIADYSRMKREMLGVFALLGAASVMAMYFTTDAQYLLAGALFISANLSFGAADVFYNSFLPELCGPKERNAVSSTGWGLAYMGGGILLILQYVFLSVSPGWGFSPDHAARACLFASGLWWGLFSTVSVLGLKSGRRSRARGGRKLNLLAGFQQLATTTRNIRHYPQTLLFLLAFLLYSDGIQTVTSISTQFGQEEIGLTVEQLAEVILLVQFVGVGGAFLFNWLAKILDTKRAIILALAAYVLIMGYAHSFLSTPFEFYLMAACIALVLVGSQALSRAAFSRMIPAGREAEYFSIYEVSERGTSWAGPLLFGLALQFTDSYRIAILALALYFVAGLLLLTKVDFRRAASEAEKEREESRDRMVYEKSVRPK